MVIKAQSILLAAVPLYDHTRHSLSQHRNGVAVQHKLIVLQTRKVNRLFPTYQKQYSASSAVHVGPRKRQVGTSSLRIHGSGTSKKAFPVLDSRDYCMIHAPHFGMY